MSIDNSDFVVAPEGQKSLRFSDEKQQARFELGVCMAIYKWDDLTTAVDNSWGGPQSADKRDWISAVVIDLFDEKELDLVTIEETLLNAMVDEFEVQIDNESGLVTAALVMQIYSDCAAQNYALVEKLYARYQQKLAAGSASASVHISDDSDSDSESCTDASSMADASSVADADGMDIDESIPEPVVDDDGFELVQRRRRR